MFLVHKAGQLDLCLFGSIRGSDQIHESIEHGGNASLGIAGSPAVEPSVLEEVGSIVVRRPPYPCEGRATSGDWDVPWVDRSEEGFCVGPRRADSSRQDLFSGPIPQEKKPPDFHLKGLYLDRKQGSGSG